MTLFTFFFIGFVLQAAGEIQLSTSPSESSSPAIAQPKPDEMCVYHFSPENDYYFSKNIVTEICHLHFRAKGSYRMIAVLDIGVEDRDEGTWRQEKKGRLVLESQNQFCDVVSGPLSIMIHHQKDIENLPQVRESIRDFLTVNEGFEYQIDTIEGIAKRRYNGGISIPTIAVGAGIESVSREALVKLGGKVDEFLESENRRLLHAIPMKYKEHIVLIWEDSETYLNRNPEEMKKWIDRDWKGFKPPSIYVDSTRQDLMSSLKNYRLNYYWEKLFGG